MSMLAEPRRKQKYSVSLNPRGSLWANDDNKFGQKLMEKMGWSKGKGLGRDEQGDADHITVKIKNNSKGIGYKGRDDTWIKHYEGFENVLAALNSENSSAANSPSNSTPNSNVNSDDESAKCNSLEARSKSSQARVHYHKFTRGKDLSRYNADDIACITGSKRAKQLAEEKERVNFKEEEVGSTQHDSGITTVKGGNIQDYFAKKMALFKGKLQTQQSAPGVFDDPQEMDNEDEGIERIGEEKETYSSYDTEHNAAEELEGKNVQDFEEDVGVQKKKKTKKRKHISEDTEVSFDDNGNETKKTATGEIESNEDENAMHREECSAEKPLKKKKKKKKMLSDQEEIEDSSEADSRLECSNKKLRKNTKESTVVDVQEIASDNRESSTVAKPKKKKKKKVLADAQEIENCTGNECIAEESRKKKIKKSLDDTQEDGIVNEEECSIEKPKKKKKKNTALLDSQEKKSDDENEITAKRPKKKKKQVME